MIVQFPKKEPLEAVPDADPKADIEALATMLRYIEAEARRLRLDDVMLHVGSALRGLDPQ